MANKKDIPDFTVSSALLYVAQTNPKTEQDYMNMSAAQDMIKKSGLTAREIRDKTRQLLKKDKKDKEIIAEQTQAGLIKGKIEPPISPPPKTLKELYKERLDQGRGSDKIPSVGEALIAGASALKRKFTGDDQRKIYGTPTKNKKGGVILKTNKEKMAYGGMASGKKHMYATGGSVKDNAGLRALKKASPMAYNKIKGIV